MHLSSLISLLLAPVVLVAGDGHMMEEVCSVDHLNTCTSSLQPIGDTIAPNVSPTELNSMCTAWTNAKPCVNEVTDACGTSSGDDGNTTSEDIVAHKSASQRAGEWTHGYEYLCGEGKPKLETDVHSCMTDSENITLLAEACYHTYDNKTWWLDTNEPTNTYKFCTAGKDLIKCLKKAGEDECGFDVGEWIWTYHGELWTPHFTDIECSLVTKFSAGAIAIVSICAGATGAVVFFTLLSCCVKPHEPKKKSSDKETKEGDKENKEGKREEDKGKENEAYMKENGDLEDGLTRRTNAERKAQEVTKM